MKRLATWLLGCVVLMCMAACGGDDYSAEFSDVLSNEWMVVGDYPSSTNKDNLVSFKNSKLTMYIPVKVNSYWGHSETRVDYKKKKNNTLSLKYNGVDVGSASFSNVTSSTMVLIINWRIEADEEEYIGEVIEVEKMYNCKLKMD